MFAPNPKALRRALRFYIEGSGGGTTRLRILLLLEKRPLNINEISKNLSIDYKTAQHHIRVLEKSNLITSKGKTYDNPYSLSILMTSNKTIMDDLRNLGKSK